MNKIKKERDISSFKLQYVLKIETNQHLKVCTFISSKFDSNTFEILAEFLSTQKY